jgi:predicted DNA-binding transcriptional regulator YafY
MRADRLLSIVMFLQARGRMTASELAEELEVSERTIYRDLEALNAAGVPVLTDRGPGGGCTLPEKYRTDLTGLTGPEIHALFMSSMPGPLSDLGLGKAIDAALLKLTASLPTVQRRDAERVRKRVHLDAAQWFQPEEPVPHLQLVQEAVWQDLRLRMTYRRADGRWVRRLVDPYGLVAKASVWYMVAGVLGKVNPYRVSRIMEAELTDHHFERPADFDLEKYWASYCAEFEASVPKYKVKLRVSPGVAAVLPNVYGEGMHSLIQQAGSPDEQGWITLTLTFESYDAAVSGILGLGTGLEILAPAELREGVFQQAKKIAESLAASPAGRR